MKIEHNPDRFLANAPVCVGCPFRNLGICKKDNAPVHLHADAGYCPESRFSDSRPAPQGWDAADWMDCGYVIGGATPSLPLAGDLLAAAISHFGESRLIKLAKRVLGPECGCAERQAKLNRLDAALRRRFRK